MRRWRSAWIAAGLLSGIAGAALDPYVAVRDAYAQYRAGKVRGK